MWVFSCCTMGSMTRSAALILVLALVAAVTPVAGGCPCELCPPLPPVAQVSPDLAPVPRVHLGPTDPWWTLGHDFEVRVSLEKSATDDEHPCAFGAGSLIWVNFEVKNSSAERYTLFYPSGKFWDLYVYNLQGTELITRLSWTAGYTDDRRLIDLLPGETKTEPRLWMPLYGDYTPIPPGMYRAYARLEPQGGTLPLFGRDDTTLSAGVTLLIVD